MPGSLISSIHNRNGAQATASCMGQGVSFEPNSRQLPEIKRGLSARFSPSSRGVPAERIVINQESLAFAPDGEVFEVLAQKLAAAMAGSGKTPSQQVLSAAYEIAAVLGRADFQSVEPRELEAVFSRSQTEDAGYAKREIEVAPRKVGEGAPGDCTQITVSQSNCGETTVKVTRSTQWMVTESVKERNLARSSNVECVVVVDFRATPVDKKGIKLRANISGDIKPASDSAQDKNLFLQGERGRSLVSAFLDAIRNAFCHIFGYDRIDPKLTDTAPSLHVPASPACAHAEEIFLPGSEFRKLAGDQTVVQFEPHKFLLHSMSWAERAVRYVTNQNDQPASGFFDHLSKRFGSDVGAVAFNMAREVGGRAVSGPADCRSALTESQVAKGWGYAVVLADESKRAALGERAVNGQRALFARSVFGRDVNDHGQGDTTQKIKEDRQALCEMLLHQSAINADLLVGKEKALAQSILTYVNGLTTAELKARLEARQSQQKVVGIVQRLACGATNGRDKSSFLELAMEMGRAVTGTSDKYNAEAQAIGLTLMVRVAADGFTPRRGAQPL
jgi:hypothetical protein